MLSSSHFYKSFVCVCVLIAFFFFSCVAEIAQLTSYDSGIAETPDTDDSVSVSSVESYCKSVI